MAVVKSLGYQVSSRKGVQIKIPQGTNELPSIFESYSKEKHLNTTTKVLTSDPSCVLVPEIDILKGSWTPNHYSAARLQSLDQLTKNSDFYLTPLRDMVEFCADTRRNESKQVDWAYISVLHILGEGFIDIKGALRYTPKTPGVQTYPGEMLISRINPRIPRVCITPDLGTKTLCSSEFEIMKPRDGVDIYALSYLLQTEYVQNQIRSLTSGTSASHNRIRTSELGLVMVPVAKRNSSSERILKSLVKDYHEVLSNLSKSAEKLANIRLKDSNLFTMPASDKTS